MLDAAVDRFFDRVTTAAALAPKETIDELRELHRVTEDEGSRVALVTLYDSLMDLFERNGADPAATAPLRLSEHRTFCLTEALGPDGLVVPEELKRVVDREIAAGRMPRDSFSELADSGAAVLGSHKPRKPRGLLKLFGRG